MIALLQRVHHARVDVGDDCVGAIDKGLLVFVGVQPDDGEVQAERMAERLLNYRVFADAEGRMNRSVTDIDGELLVVSQFTLAADTGGGNRPSFTGAASAAQGRALYEQVLELARASGLAVGSGEFGADMQVHLVNDGPVTIPITLR